MLKVYIFPLVPPRLLRWHIQSDHPVLDSRFLLWEAQQAHYYGLPENVAIAAVTSSPAEVISSASRITTSPRPQKLKALRAPKGLSFSVTLRLSSLISPDTLPVEHNFETGCKTFDLSLHEPSGLSSWYDAAQFGALDSLNWISLHVLC